MRLGSELIAQSAVFNLQVLDHRLLVTIDPAGEHQHGREERAEEEQVAGTGLHHDYRVAA
jgi:hypothetical protein